MPWRSVLTFVGFLFGILSARAQSGADTIAWSSTCVNSSVVFSSPLLDSLFSPDYIRWHFGDPASGYNDSSAGKNPVHIFTSTGTYAVSLDVWYAGSDTIVLRKTITIVTPMNFNLGPDIYVCGQNPNVLLQGPVIPGANYTWNDDSTTHTDTLRVTQSGVYTVAVNGCWISDSVGVYASDTPQIDLGKNHVMCDSANLQLNAATQNGVYAWFLNGSLLPYTGDQLVTHYPGGTYVAVVTVPGCGTYRDTVSVTYSQPEGPPFSLGGDTLLCPNQVYTLAARLAGATAWDWSTGSTASEITVTTPGQYWVFATYNGTCQVTDTVNVTYRNNQPLDFHDTAICQGKTLVLNADFGQGTYTWTADPPQRNDQGQSGQSTYFVYQAGMFKVVAQVGQCVFTDSLRVRFDDSLHVTLLKDTTLCNGEDFALQPLGNADSYLWQDGSTGSAYHPTVNGTYTVVATNGCGTDTLSAIVDFTACSCQLMLPNAFTPDGDGRNDRFRPLHACDMSEFEMNIYDRFGVRVFHGADPEAGWDGYFGAIKAPPGVYVWTVRFFNTTAKQPVFRKGTVVLIR
jgi:gliding motility-associated-like protein